jgi:hypothetical protein
MLRGGMSKSKKKSQPARSHSDLLNVRSASAHQLPNFCSPSFPKASDLIMIGDAHVIDEYVLGCRHDRPVYATSVTGLP